MGISKFTCFETPVETDMELVAIIVAAYERRCHACIEVGGRQFEKLL